MMDEENDAAWDEGLKAKQRLFVLNYCTNQNCFLNQTAAYRITYTRKDRATGKVIFEPAKVTCETNGSRMLRNSTVKKAIYRLLKLTQADIDEQNVYRILKLLAERAFYNPADIIDAKGKIKVKKLEDLGEKAKCIEQIQKTKYGVNVTLASRDKSLDQLIKYLEMVRPEQQIDITLPVIELPAKAITDDQWNKLAEMEEQNNGIQ